MNIRVAREKKLLLNQDADGKFLPSRRRYFHKEIVEHFEIKLDVTKPNAYWSNRMLPMVFI